MSISARTHTICFPQMAQMNSEKDERKSASLAGVNVLLFHAKNAENDAMHAGNIANCQSILIPEAADTIAKLLKGRDHEHVAAVIIQVAHPGTRRRVFRR